MGPLKCALCLILSCWLPSSAFAGIEYDHITKDLPKDAVHIIDRMISCRYWKSEMPDPKKITEEVRESGRVEMIENELSQSKCSTLDADLKKAKTKFSKNKAVIEAFEKASKMTPAD